jgi:hypothetical protein
MTEGLPSSIPVTMKPQHQFSLVPSDSDYLHSQITARESGRGRNSQKVKESVPRSASSLRRSVVLTAGDNWIVPTTASVSSELFYLSEIRM